MSAAASIVRDFGREVVRIGRVFLTQPLRWRAREWLVAVVWFVAMCAAFVEKQPLQARLGGDGRGAFAAVSYVVWRVGDGWTVALLALGCALVGGAREHARVRSLGITLGAAGVWCFALTKLGQFVLAEARPVNGGVMHWFALGGHGVSGHASAAALLVGPVFASTRGKPRAFRIAVASALIAWALLVGATRIWTNNHYMWNVLAGYVVGACPGCAATCGPSRRR